MAPAPLVGEHVGHVGPHPSFIEIAKPYIFEQRVQECLTVIGMTEAKEDAVRLSGVAWIDNVRKSMQLPVRTFNTAVVYYHKFRLLHADSEYSYIDAAAAALFTACKIEDTLKKSREILCASWNLKLAPAEHLSSDDPLFEAHSKSIIGLERLMLEGASFDFRNRHPQRLVIKLVKGCGLPKDTVGRTAYSMSLDLYRTFAPLKQTTSTMAIACVELAARLHGVDLSRVIGERGIRYKKWMTSRAEVMETLLDLLDLYTHHRPSTTIGNQNPLETFIGMRIKLNQEATAGNLPRYTEWSNAPRTSPINTNGFKVRNGIAPTSPVTPITPGITSPGQGPASAIGIRGQNGTVRFMLDAARARAEKKTVDAYYTVEEEEYETEVEVTDRRRA
ncbi:C-type cyclin [Lepidopterella palustris CBS 459.81]|uniref:RNA polymerase II holoenzyme cyclin-like subunit n=1 Tax=Lepidopterella palustris CBS 459.81 TaxID=1314670 RepID=A0A8E2EEG7_9PEZI|nr:C-type cyclin [Lepidopterella palustris CBS 459.81]